MPLTVVCLSDLFHLKVPAWRSRGFVSTGIGAQITNIEGVKAGDAYEQAVKQSLVIDSERVENA